MRRLFLLPAKRGEGAERSEADEGLLKMLRKPLTRRVAKPRATLSPLRGERESTARLTHIFTPFSLRYFTAPGCQGIGEFFWI
jgi:hypothetical protein